ncbi:MAG: hypothetical protein HY094_09200 [Candidatus Melainabacteria bacterium]|nr:hypothetical protein [Candidatus Melainabacteria bacterium]
MYEVYGITLSLPEEVARGLTETNNKTTDIYIKPSSTKLYSSNKVVWYETWKGVNSGIVLSFGKRDDKWFVLDFHTDGVVFTISPDCSEIYYWAPTQKAKEEVRHLLLNTVIPLVMNHKNIETLHASSVLTSKGAIAFIGGSGDGKSTIAASLIQKGFHLVSDDKIPLYLHGEKIFIKSGPPEMNLWPRVREALNLKTIIQESQKKIFTSFTTLQHAAGSFPLVQIYFLNPIKEISPAAITSISKKEALYELIKNAQILDASDFNILKRLFLNLSQVTKHVPAKTLTYPKGIPNIEELSKILLLDINANERLTLIA